MAIGGLGALAGGIPPQITALLQAGEAKELSLESNKTLQQSAQNIAGLGTQLLSQATTALGGTKT